MRLRLISFISGVIVQTNGLPAPEQNAPSIILTKNHTHSIRSDVLSCDDGVPTIPSDYGEPKFFFTGQVCKGDGESFRWEYGWKCWYKPTIQALIDSRSPIDVPASTSDGAGCTKLGCHESAQVWVCNDNAHHITLNSLDVGWVGYEMMKTCPVYEDGNEQYNIAGQWFTDAGWNLILRGGGASEGTC